MSQIVQINAATDATALVGGTVVPSEHYQWKVEVQSTLPDGRVVTYDYEGQFGDWLYQGDDGSWQVVTDANEQAFLAKQTGYDSDITSTGMPSIATLQRQGVNDQANVTTLDGQCAQYQTDFATQSTNFTPWTPQAVYTPSDLSTLHDQIVWILNEMGPVMSAISSLSRWRSDADSIVINICNTLTWICKKITGQ